LVDRTKMQAGALWLASGTAPAPGPRRADDREERGMWPTAELHVHIEGTLDADPGPGSTWREYEFRGKPGDVRRLPRQYAPYHLRLDWLMWFLALGSSAQLQWFVPFLGRLLEADRPTLRLLAHDPFDGQRPRWVRARLYRYRFATPAERRSTGDRWVRHDEGLMVDAVSLAMLARAG